MRLVIQRVAQASVTSSVPGQPTVTSSIDRGLMVLVGFEKTDTAAEMVAMKDKLFKLKLFNSDDPPKKNAHSVIDAKLDLLLVSQFTLAASLKGGGRPSFHNAKGGEEASTMFTQFIEMCREALPGESRLQSGIFGSYMQVHLVNDGPYTICLTCKDGKCDMW